jgi:ABC-type molybdate transport system substrate-binding protein
VKTVAGAKLVGLLLPPDLRFTIVYGKAVPNHDAAPEAALAFVKFISNSDKAERWKAFGFEPGEGF